MTKLNLIATTAFGLENVTAREIKNLGYEDGVTENGRVNFIGDERSIARANIWLRTAGRVLIKMAEFGAVTFEELFQGTKLVDWADWFEEDAKIIVTGKSVNSGLFSVSDCQAIVKKAIIEKMKIKYNREIFEESGSTYKVEISMLKDIAILTLDTSGEGLHRRKYRTLAGEAPIKESMASALIQLSFWKNERILVDPMCGTGTIPIEAALIAKNIAPGLGHSFLSETWRNIPKNIWDEARIEAHDLIRNDIKPNIYGMDIDDKAVSLSQQHAKQAGVADCVHIRKAALKNFTSNEKYGFIITNPPYGERLGELREVEQIYKEMAEICGKLDTWSFYIISSHPDFEKFFGKRADKRRKLYNARLQCQYYQYYGPKPPRIEKINEITEDN